MVTMKNIVVNNNIISAKCYAENDVNKCFTLKIDADDFHVIENSLGTMNIYCRMAINKIKSTLIEEKQLPTELCSVWC